MWNMCSAEICAALGLYTTYHGNSVPTFQVEVQELDFLFMQVLIVSQAYCVKVLTGLLQGVLRQWPELRPNSLFHYHDCASSHQVLSVKQLMAKRNLLLDWNSPTPPLFTGFGSQ